MQKSLISALCSLQVLARLVERLTDLPRLPAAGMNDIRISFTSTETLWESYVATKRELTVS